MKNQKKNSSKKIIPGIGEFITPEEAAKKLGVKYSLDNSYERHLKPELKSGDN